MTILHLPVVSETPATREYQIKCTYDVLCVVLAHLVVDVGLPEEGPTCDALSIAIDQLLEEA